MKVLKTFSGIFLDALLVIQTEDIKGMDAIHIAIASHYNCKTFASSDPHFLHLNQNHPVYLY